MGVALVIGSACCFGSLGVFGKLAYRLGLTTPQLLSYRFALAAVLLWLAAAVTRQGLPPRHSLVGLAIMGGAGYVGQSAAYFSALHFIPVSTTALLLYTFPVVATLLATFLFHEPLGWTKIVAVVLAFIGTMLVVQAQLTAASPIGIILGLRLLGASRSAILSTFEPASSVLLAVLILGEAANPIQYLGGAFILSSVVVLEGRGWLASRALAQATRE